MLFTLPAWAVLTGVALDALIDLKTSRWGLVPFAAVILYFAGLGQQGLRQKSPPGTFDYWHAVMNVIDHVQPGDAVTFEGERHAWHLRLGFRYWLRNKPNLLRDVFLRPGAPARDGFKVWLCKDARACLPDDVERLWLVTCSPEKQLFDGIPRSRERLLRSKFEVEADSVRSVRRIRTALLVRR